MTGKIEGCHELDPQGQLELSRFKVVEKSNQSVKVMNDFFHSMVVYDTWGQFSATSRSLTVYLGTQYVATDVTPTAFSVSSSHELRMHFWTQVLPWFTYRL